MKYNTNPLVFLTIDIIHKLKIHKNSLDYLNIENLPIPSTCLYNPLDYLEAINIATLYIKFAIKF